LITMMMTRTSSTNSRVTNWQTINYFNRLKFATKIANKNLGNIFFN
jgi:hypothetical protein